ncbi:MAG: hypothetical protein ACK51F_13745, partial [Rhodospirillales bacterium]
MRAVLWLCAAALPVALVFVIWPGIDLTVAALAYTPGEGFVLARDPVANEIQVWLGRAVAAAVGLGAALGAMRIGQGGHFF